MTLSYWALAGIILLTIFLTNLSMVLVGGWIVKGTQNKYIYLLPMYPMGISQRKRAIAKQLNTDKSKIHYKGNNIYEVDGTDYELRAFCGVCLTTLDGLLLNKEVIPYVVTNYATDTEQQPELNTEQQPELNTEQQPELETEQQLEVNTEQQPELETEQQLEVNTEQQLEVNAEQQPELETEQQPKGRNAGKQKRKNK